MTGLDTQTTIAELVRERPSRTRVFEQYGIDYCCNGKRPLAEVLERQKLPAADVLAAIEAVDARPAAGEPDLAAMSLTELADHIEQTHHAFLRRELPRLASLTDKVAAVHGGKEERLTEVQETLAGLTAELTSHMFKEEQILFPLLRQMDATAGPVEHHCGSVANPIRVMEFEHDHAGQALDRLRSLTDEYAAPEWACGSYRALLDGLRGLEADLHQHIHKENNLLFPMALERESA